MSNSRPFRASLSFLLVAALGACTSTGSTPHRAAPQETASQPSLKATAEPSVKLKPVTDDSWGFSQRPFLFGSHAMFQTETATPEYAIATFTFEGICAPAVEVNVLFDASGVVAKAVRTFDGDRNSDKFVLRPMIDEVRRAFTEHCQDLEHLSFRLVDGSDRSTAEPFGYLHLAKADGWKIEQGQYSIDANYQAKKKTADYVPPRGQEGLLPTHAEYANYLSGQAQRVQLPTRDWSLYFRSGPVHYEYTRDYKDSTRIMIRATTGTCPPEPVTYDLHLNVDDFGGSDRAFGIVKAELDAFSTTALSRVVCTYLAEYTRCAERTGRPTRDATVQVFDQTNLSTPLGSIVYRYLDHTATIIGPDGASHERVFLRTDYPGADELVAAAVGKRLAFETQEQQLAQQKTEHLAREAEIAGRSKAEANAAYAAMLERMAHLEQNSPFAGYSAGVYFGALLERDYEITTHLDSEYSQIYRKIMEGDAAEAFALFSMLANGQMEGFEERTEAVREATESVSLLFSMLSYYLKVYPRVYDATCLGDDPQVVTVITTEQTIDGTGTPVGPATETPTHFPVKREFHAILNEIVLQPASLAADFDLIFRGQDFSISQADMLMGIDQIMENFTCDSTEILKLEQSFREYWAIINARVEPARQKILERR